jgi:hypothetical protein
MLLVFQNYQPFKMYFNHVFEVAALVELQTAKDA